MIPSSPDIPTARGPTWRPQQGDHLSWRSELTCVVDVLGPLSANRSIRLATADVDQELSTLLPGSASAPFMLPRRVYPICMPFCSVPVYLAA